MNGDGRLDLVSGENWYEQMAPDPGSGPRFMKHKFRDLPYTFDYLEDLSDLAIDVNGDGRTDIITPQGWFEAPRDPRKGQWIFHPEFDLGMVGFIHVHDVNGDGLTDLVTSAAHSYGLFWWEQKRDVNGNRTWVKHVIDNAWSQAHATTLEDLNGDGRPELVTGKRYYAHDHDPGANEPLGVYWYEALDAEGASWRRHVLDYSTRTGGGMQIPVVDIDGDGDLDIVVAGKSGLFLFENLSTSR
jgi:hypothetical protein